MFAMVIEEQYQSLWDWAEPSQVLLFWLVSVGSLALMCLVGAFLYSSIYYRNPLKGAAATLKGFLTGVLEIARAFTPGGIRRTLAMAVLTFKEAIRRRVLYVFVLFFAPFLFAGWYLPKATEGQILFLVAFVNNAMTWLLLPLAAIMVSMTLPNDLKNRTIQTVVTKPVRRIEIILGRIAGFMAIYTIILLIMGGVGLAYLASQVTQEAADIGWTARVPVYATSPSPDRPPLIFVKNGVPRAQGTNVGKEWGYRSHIEGATADSAHWYFNFDPADFANQETVRAEITFDIFKTTKGNPTRKSDAKSGVWCSMTFKNPRTGESLHNQVFHVNNNRITELASLPGDMFKNGEIEVIAQCLTPNQFLGMAIHDVYFLAAERPFQLNYAKGLFGLWLKLLFITCVSVSASTVLNGFVTFLFTIMVYVLGLFYNFLVAVIRGDIEGGGPVESLIRLVTQDNQVTLLEPTWYNVLAQRTDHVLLWVLEVIARIIPNLTTLDTTQYVAEGFNIPPLLLVRNALIVLGYVIPLIIGGYFLFRSREVAV
jgi:ABC-type transport system involved in multi-copper enzyme maturation permease subunit